MFDVAIIGGGLAGCSAAIHLAKQNLRVVLFEANTYPHHKVCGEFLSPECAYLLDELGVMAAISALQPATITTVTISSPDNTVWESNLPGAAIGVSRYVLDDCLAKQATAQGVDLRQGTKVIGVSGNLDQTFKLQVRSPSGTEAISAKLVIGAQGKRSILDRSLNRTFLQKHQPFVALKTHFYHLPLPQRIELHTFEGGYCGMSEIEGDKTNVCLLVREEIFQGASHHASDPIAAFIQWMQQKNTRLAERLSQAQQADERWLSISQVPFLQKSVIENDVLMAGDAARLIAPLAGDGMAMALQTGRLAVNHTSTFLLGQVSADQLRHRYAAAWAKEFRLRLALGQTLQSIMMRPKLLDVGLRILNTIPSFGDFLIKHTRDTTFIGKAQKVTE